MTFHVERMDPQTWRIEEGDGPGRVYMYLLCGREKALLLDTGFGSGDLHSLVAGLTELPVEVLCTHGHFDHIGGNHQFQKVRLHEGDRLLYELHTSEGYLSRLSVTAPLQGVHLVTLFSGEPTHDLGGRPLEIIHTPGHSCGSVCVLDCSRRWLFTGDSCCRADVLLNMEYSATVSTYAESIRRLLARSGEYDLTWPSHHGVPVSTQILEQYSSAAEMIISGSAKGIPIHSTLGDGLRFAYKDIAIVYDPERI